MINREIFESLKERFNIYTKQFKSNDFFVQKHFNVKIEHTYRVVDNIEKIAKNIGLNEQQTLIVKIAGLFHDIGRFEQYNKFHTFSDLESVSHSDIGVETIKNNDFLKLLSQPVRGIIYDVILNHNKPELDDSDTPTNLYSKILRDADKLDIFKVVTDYDKQEGQLQAVIENQYKISDVILNSFTRHKIVDINKNSSTYDMFLYRISWVFDVNFQVTFQLLDKSGDLQYLLDRIPKSYRLMNIQRVVKEYMVEKIFTYA